MELGDPTAPDDAEELARVERELDRLGGPDPVVGARIRRQLDQAITVEEYEARSGR